MTTQHFDKKAPTWDENPRRRAIAEAVSAAVRQSLPLQDDWLVLDVGCGTGLLGLSLADCVAGVHGIDTSAGMVEQFLAKAAGRPGISAEVRDLLAEPYKKPQFDAVVSAMAFHHIPDTVAMLASLNRCLLPGGWLAIADLCAEDGSFHPADEAVPHHGFPGEALALLMEKAGFAEVGIRVIHRISKETRAEPYPVFLATARRI